MAFYTQLLGECCKGILQCPCMCSVQLVLSEELYNVEILTSKFVLLQHRYIPTCATWQLCKYWLLLPSYLPTFLRHAPSCQSCRYTDLNLS